LHIFARFIKEQLGKTHGIPPYIGQCVMLFWYWNKFYGTNEPYSAPGACNLFTTTAGQPYIWDSFERLAPSQLRPGAWTIWSGTSGAYPNAGSGHVALLVKLNGNGTGLFFTENPGPAQLVTLSLAGIIGGLLPKGVGAWDGSLDDGATAVRHVTNTVAYARTAPKSTAPAAPEYPEGIAQGAPLAVRGYVQGQDPYGTGDDAWYVTQSGYYVWANAAGNDLAGLAFLGAMR
jgi:hypothetical protein